MAVKLKGVGKIVAHASTGVPTKRASDYDVAWVSGLKFNWVATSLPASTVKCRPDVAGSFPRGVTHTAAVASELRKRFSDADALVLADRIAGVSGGH